MLALIGRLREAKYKGVSFLVSNSSITFGQKTVTHNYPDTNKTEVEFLGLSEDQFELDIYINGNGYIEKRKRLKNKLEEPSAGILIHPYQGQVNCSVVSARLVENDTSLGIAKFSVTFQKSSKQPYPTTSTNTKPFILRKLDALLDAVSDGTDVLTNEYDDNAIFSSETLNDVADTFDKSIGLTYKLADKTNQLNDEIINFRSQINTYSQAPSLLGASMKNLFNTLNFISSDNREQIRILKQFYDFGSTYKPIPQTTLQRVERNDVRKNITNAMLSNSLGLAYATSSEIDYTNNDDLETVRNELEDQYESIKEDLDNDILNSLEDLRNDTLTYLDSLELAEVSTISIKPTSILLLAYDYYGDITKYDTLFDLNKPKDPAFITIEAMIVNE